MASTIFRSTFGCQGLRAPFSRVCSTNVLTVSLCHFFHDGLGFLVQLRVVHVVGLSDAFHPHYGHALSFDSSRDELGVLDCDCVFKRCIELAEVEAFMHHRRGMARAGLAQRQLDQLVDALLYGLDALFEADLGVLDHLRITVPRQCLHRDESDGLVLILGPLEQIVEGLHLELRDEVVAEDGQVVFRGLAAQIDEAADDLFEAVDDWVEEAANCSIVGAQHRSPEEVDVRHRANED